MRFWPQSIFLVAALQIGLTFAGAQAAQAACICIQCAFRTHHMFVMTAESMSPALPTGDCVIARRLDAAADPPRPGDIVFFVKRGDTVPHAGRVIATAGQRFEMDDGLPVIDGRPVKQEPMSDYARKHTK